VGVFVDENIKKIRDIVDFCGLDLVQLHGNESPDVCNGFMPRTIKTIHLRHKSDIRMLKPYQGKVRAFLFDTYSGERSGGTGKSFDWNLALGTKALGVPIILSGGLKPSNIRQAILTVKPYAVDVNSGIEVFPGKKNPLLMKTMMTKIKRMNRGTLPDD
jgi:phosphoribosylanthranilate isomerase